MPKQVGNVRAFMELVKRPHVKSVFVKRNKDQCKFKARTPRRLYTLVIKDMDSVSKLEHAIRDLGVQVSS